MEQVWAGPVQGRAERMATVGLADPPPPGEAIIVAGPRFAQHLGQGWAKFLAPLDRSLSVGDDC